ncbi:hypothetical protein DPSP01_013103 [Paraphaeosphaeria sporulosa]
MFSGYLQAAIYRGMDGTAGLFGWQWLFIFCGIISIWGPFWGFYSIPDNSYTTKARWMPADEPKIHSARISALERRKPIPLSKKELKVIATHGDDLGCGEV